MARKRKTVLSDDDHDYEAESDAYLPQKSRKTVSRKKPQTKAGGKKRQSSWGLGDMGEDGAGPSQSIQAFPHSSALHVLSSPEPPRQALLKWYDGVHTARGMPWRKPFQHSWDAEERAQRAYEVWVSEIMLQQTQVATVIPYYNKWMERFPTIRDLAASDIDTVNGLWKGLGYYSRAARLLSGARKVVEEFEGRLPDNAQDMESKIPGIGRYSAGAICSIAYSQCVPVLDGNVHRLLSRVLALHAPPKAKQTLDVLWAGASAFVKDAERPGDVNQALIELGSTVCKVRDPACGSCPLQPWCAAYERERAQGKEDKGPKVTTSSAGHAVPDIEDLCTLCEPLPAGAAVTAYPMKAEKKKAREELDIVSVIEWRKHAAGERWFLLVRRPEGGLLAGLHEFPTAPNVPVTAASSSAHIEIADALLSVLLVSPPSAHSAAASQAGQATTRRKAPPAPSPRSVRVAKVVSAGDVLHVFSHIRKTYRVQWVLLEGGGDDPPALSRAPDFDALGAAATVQRKAVTSRGKARGKTRGGAPGEGRGSPPRAGMPPPAQATQWVRLGDVADANIGTGVMKIWRQVSALWEGVDADSQ